MVNREALPVLYSLQHCPYAMRARMGIWLAGQSVMLRAVVTKNKPPEMLAASPKGTVPVLVLDDGTVIDESLKIMLWALNKSDPQNLLYGHDSPALSTMLTLITLNDKQFKPCLEKYKFAKRKHEKSEIYYRRQCEVFVTQFESTLSRQTYFMGETPSLADYALLPFIRQFARVDRHWYLQSPYPNLRRWLNGHLQAPLFTKVMAKFPLWLASHEEFLYGGK
ncbi:MAG: glutathione S-transferase [Thiotrichaceae bacterium]|nr:glutathione S-transferase [Thiotrichaceae bacterium]PCI13467.1 MAG: glutathione S-transferase [Thiotrichales bacterium]